MRLADLTYPEVKAVLERGAVALWPAGSTEAHGPHLPLSTDVLIAEETCRRAAPALKAALGLEAVILPPLGYTVTEFAAPFAGTLSIPKATVVAFVRDVLLATAAQGFRAVCLVNAHLEPAHRFALRDAVEAARATAACPLALADPCDKRWVPTLTEEFRSGACHAGQYESSLILAIPGAPLRDELRAGLPRVEVDLMGGIRGGAANFLEMGATSGYFGDPRLASPEEGEATYQQLAAIVTTMVQEALASPGARDP